MYRTGFSRRTLLKGSVAATAGLVAAPLVMRRAWAEEFRNNPGNSANVVFGFNVPQTGAYADEGADELRAYQLAVKHLNGEGDGGMLNTMTPKSLKGNGVLGKKVTFVTGDTQTKSDAARASAKRMIEKDGVIMFTGGSSSGTAIAQQSLAQEMGIIFMCGLNPFQRHHRQGPAALRLPPLLQCLHVGPGARAGAGAGIRQGPQGLSPDRRLYLGLDPGGVDQERHRGPGLGDRRGGPHAARRRRLLAVHHAGAEFPAPTC